MSKLYEHYVKGKKPAEITHGIVTDIRRHRLVGNDVNSLITELEQKGMLGDTTVKPAHKSEWNEKYLKLLVSEAVRGTFSKQYLLHLAEVVEHISRSDNKSNSKKIVPVILIIAIIIAIVVLVIANKEPRSS
ncbi:MAG: hypothetical protein FWG88_10910 [Oscillospiraceae bacterium]|nr:hypothetical protein [Oscillospiraceae bacterium]